MENPRPAWPFRKETEGKKKKCLMPCWSGRWGTVVPFRVDSSIGYRPGSSVKLAKPHTKSKCRLCCQPRFKPLLGGTVLGLARCFLSILFFPKHLYS